MTNIINRNTAEALKITQQLTVIYSLFTGCQDNEISKNELHEVITAMGTGINDVHMFLSKIEL